MKSLSFDLSWATPESYFGIADQVDQDVVEDMVKETFPDLSWNGSGGGFYSRDIDWTVPAHVDQATLDTLGNKLAREFPGRTFHLSQGAWDFELEDCYLEDQCGPRGEYHHLPEGEDA